VQILDIYKTWAEIDLDALAHNFMQIRKTIPNNTKIMSVVKADAYGHGHQMVSKKLVQMNTDYFAVATTTEGAQLRREGIETPILILGAASSDEFSVFFEYDLIPTLYDLPFSESLNDYARTKNKKIKAHLKIDTGMNRIGFSQSSDQTINEIINIYSLDNIEIEGIYTHFASSDKESDAYTKMQYERFMKICDELASNGVYIPLKHCSNSGAVLNYRDLCLDIVRPGIILYGHYPNDDIAQSNPLFLKNVMSLKSKIGQLRVINSGDRVSYGGDFVANKKTLIATIPIGYADGYSRLLSGKAYAKVKGYSVKSVGRICMDMCMFDVTDVDSVCKGDTIILFGGDSSSYVPVEQLAKEMGSISYEILCMVGKRIPRVYV